MTTTPIDYTSRDFDSLRASLVNRVAIVLPEWTNLTAGDFGVVLIELFSSMGDSLNFYIDRVANEAFLDTAVLRQSVLRMADMLDYQPVQQSAASCTIQFTLGAAASGITIPKGTQVLTAASSDGGAPIRFETTADITIAALGGTGTVAANEGTTITHEAVAQSDGTSFQKYQLYNPGVISGSLVLEVADGVSGAFTTWALVQNFVDAKPSSAVYRMDIDENNVASVSFSDGLTGKLPPIGAIIRATYRYGVGAAGNVGVGTVNVIGIAIASVNSAINTTAATGGADAESIESIKTAAPLALQAQHRAVTLSDFSNLSLAVAGVSKASATGAVWTSITVYVAPAGGGLPSPTLKTAVVNYFADKKLSGSTVTVLDPVYVGVLLGVTLTIDDAYVQSVVLSGVQQAVANFFAFDATNFGQSVSASQLYKVLHSVAGVVDANITLLVRSDAVLPTGVQTIVCGPGEIPQIATYTPVGSGGI